MFPKHLRTAAFGLSVLLSAGVQTAVAADAVVQNFGDWKVTIQPGIRGSSPQWHSPAAAKESPIRLVSQVETFPVDETVVPPAPAQPEGVEIVTPVEPKSDTIPAHTATTCPSINPAGLVQLYSQIYDSIPFSRAEYEANPSYRHDATMEFLFGQMRPTVIQRSRTTVNHRHFGYPIPSPAYSPYGFNSYYYPFHAGYVAPYSLW